LGPHWEKFLQGNQNNQDENFYGKDEGS
jgi:hypothetical protein